MSKRFWIGIILFFIVVSGVFFHPYFTKNQIPLPANLLVSYYNPWKNEGFAKVSNKPIGFDIARLFFPFREFTTEQLKKGKLPLWNPYIFSGNVHLATYQSAVFYPLNILYFILPVVDAWSALVMLQPVIAGIGMYLFLKNQKLSFQARLLGSIFWAFSGWMMAWSEESLVIEHSILWLPIAFLGSSLIWQKRYALGFCSLTGALGLSILAGFTQSTIYLVLFTSFWHMWLFLQNRKRSTTPIIIYFSSCATALLITAIQWVPALEVYTYSARGVVDIKFVFESYLLPLRHLVTFFAPDFWGNPGTYSYFLYDGFYHERVLYMGIIPLLFAIFALLKNKDKPILFWKVATLVTLLFALNTPISWLLYSFKVPLLSVMQPTRVLMLFAFSASVLAAYGYEHFSRSRNWRHMITPLTLIGVIAGISWAFVGFVRFIPSICEQFVAQNEVIKNFCLGIQLGKTPEILEQYGRVSLRNLLLPTGIFLSLCFLLLFFSTRKKIFFL